MKERGYDNRARSDWPLPEAGQQSGDPSGFGPAGTTTPTKGQVKQGKKKTRRKWPVAVLAAAMVLIVAYLVGVKISAGGRMAAPAATPAPAAHTVPAAAVNNVASAGTTQMVTYSCTGHVPSDVLITYGPNGTESIVAALPFTRTAALDTKAQFYVTEVHLQATGSVSCQIALNYRTSSGAIASVTNTAGASGGYEIASAQVCSDFHGGWKEC
jgi:hypothetical protein